MKKLILTVGASGSGKTYWAEEFVRNRNDWVNLNRDDVRFNLFCNGVRDWSRYTFNNKNEKRVTEIIDQLAFDASINDKNILVSDTNLSEKTRNKWKEFAKTHGYEYEEISFITNWDKLLKRNTNRQGGISTTVLRSQYLRMNDYIGRKKYVPDTTKPKAFLIDLDGSVASMEGVRKPFEWDKVGQDKPREIVISMVQGLIEAGYTPIFMSGRDGCCMEATYDWIMEHIMQWYLPESGGFHLYMRTAGDNRKDSIIKEELFWKYVANNFNVCSAIDDRDSIIELWEELSIPNIINVNGSLYRRF